MPCPHEGGGGGGGGGGEVGVGEVGGVAKLHLVGALFGGGLCLGACQVCPALNPALTTPSPWRWTAVVNIIKLVSPSGHYYSITKLSFNFSHECYHLASVTKLNKILAVT